MDANVVAVLASKATEHGPTFLGEDLVGWRTALIAAIPAALLYEIGISLTRKVTLRLPFLVLYTARIGVPKQDWKYQYSEWRAELWFILRDRETHWLARFAKGMIFAAPLALGGAKRAARAAADGAPRRALLRLLKPSYAVLGAESALGSLTATYLPRLVPGMPEFAPPLILVIWGIAGVPICVRARRDWDPKVQRKLNSITSEAHYQK
ncbi:hypothetical protein SAMN05216532_3444 [Streptomyces sp. 2231.1]|uniref:hypothetical protein n=1 Tax=Streptomyces sp. 2231.1 TaxID=1855347 RepID=UPI000897DC27|nr:hypothetical protein [Streptomyces sp. 2231.1]SED10363.1 hypothetical protein SAMN05216532_3444 [Streptomyces sp. 2231.1]